MIGIITIILITVLMVNDTELRSMFLELNFLNTYINISILWYAQMCHGNSGVDTVTLYLTNIEMLTRHKTKTGKPICYGERANVLIHKQDLGWWFKITVFVKNWPTIFSDWIRPGLYNLDYNKMSSDELYKRKEKAIIDEVNDVLEEWDGWNLLPDLIEENVYQDLED